MMGSASNAEPRRARSSARVRARKRHESRDDVIAGFIVDFYCAQCRLAIELDGDIHASTRDDDAHRTSALEAIGVTVLRFPNDDAPSPPLLSPGFGRKERGVGG